MKWLRNKIKKYYYKDIDGTGLALFRISFCIVMILELAHSIYFRDLIFNAPVVIITLDIWLLVLIFLLLGAFTKIVSILNYVLCIVVITQQIHGYHMSYAYFGVSFLFLFLPISRNLSIDRLLLKLKYSSTKHIYNPSRKVSSLAYFLPLLLGPAILYFESALNWKVLSPVWMKGLGMWLPGSIPYLVYQDLSGILNQKYLNLLCGYLTLVFELAFIFLMWFKKFRYILSVIGLGLHLGILIFFPIPLFALGMSCYYFLLLPAGIWKKICSFFRGRKKRIALKFYYDDECPLCIRTKVIIEHFDIFKKIKFLSIQHYSKTEKALKNISQDELLKNIYSIDKSGKIYNGVDTYIQVLYFLGYTIPIGILLSIPGFYHITRFVYKKIALARYTQRCTEQSCSLVVNTLPVNSEDQKIFMNYTIADFKIDCIKWTLVIIFFFQFCISLNYGLLNKIANKAGLSQNFFLKKIGNMVKTPGKLFLGLGTHAVYMDYAYYNYEIKVSYISNENKKIIVPIIKDNGLAGIYMIGPNYVTFLFYCQNKNSISDGNVLVSVFDEHIFSKELNPWITFWAKRNKIKPNVGKSLLELREFNIPDHWEENALRNAMAQPWKEIGEFTWDGENNIKIYFNREGKNKLGKAVFHNL